MLHRTMSFPRVAKPGRFRPEHLFHPASVAVLGAETAAGQHVLANLRGGDFGGKILLAESGADLSQLGVTPELAVVCNDGPAVAGAFAALGKAGTTAAIVVGMADGLRDLARATGVRSLGPGSFGIAVPAIGLNASRAHIAPKPGRVALVSQSAALCRAVLDWAEPNGVGFSNIVGIGGNDDIGFALVLDWLSRDPGTGVILLDIRRIRNARMFLSAARAAARLRPMVAIRAGGRLLDPTGAADDTLEAALRRCGVLCVTRLDDMLAAAETLTRAKPVRSEALAIVTNAIGPAWMAADAALREGLALAELAPATRAVLAGVLPLAASPSVYRPDERTAGDLVYTGVESPIRLAETAALLAGAREVGGILIVHAPVGEADGAGIAAIAAAAKAIRVPLLVCAMGETTGAVHRRNLAEAGVPVFATPEQAVRGFLHLVQDRRNRAAARELPPSAVLRVAPDQSAVAAAFARARADGRLTLTQDEAMAVLAAYHIESVPSRRVADAETAVVAAAEIGYPVVLKRRRCDRPAAGGRGALMLDLGDDDQVRNAIRVLERRASPRDSGGFLVQHQCGRVRELLVRVSDDVVFGPAISFGQGGTAASVFRDVATDLPPLNLPLAHALIERTRVARTFAARHDLPAADTSAVADTLVRVSQLVVDFPEIAELDVNPLFADANGVRVADAWIRLRAAGEPPGELAIAPYPVELIGKFEAAGETLTVRPIRPEDAAAHGAFFARLSPEDVRYRFFSAMRDLSPEQMMRLTQVDYDREIAFVAVREATGETVGVSRLVREMNGTAGEFAVVVQPDMKGRGLARHLMQRLIDWGRGQGMSEIVGQVLADNAPMLSFVRHLGFAIHRLPDEDGVVEAALPLAPEPPLLPERSAQERPEPSA
jgi:acetyltransferase